MKKLLKTIEDMWVTVTFAEHDALPVDNRAGLEAETALACLRGEIR
jgi:hypothetical protein